MQVFALLLCVLRADTASWCDAAIWSCATRANFGGRLQRQLMRPPIEAAPIGAVGLAMRTGMGLRVGMGLLQRAGNRRCPDGQIARRIGQQAPA